MQTFLPYPNFTASAMCLDRARLGKQRVEAQQIVAALEYRSGGWYNHPATKMWEGYRQAIMLYRDVCIEEWKRRGYENNIFQSFFNDRGIISAAGAVRMPPWLGDERVHSSHRANLLRKDPEYYGKFGWTEEPAEGYYWPKKEKVK